MYGIKRGLFSNEAGVGSAPNASASAEVSHPAKQGLVQVLSVFIDTLLVCSATAFMCMCSGVEPTVKLSGAPYVQAAVQNALGAFGPVFITVAMILFAFTTLLGNLYYVDRSLAYMLGKQPGKVFMRIYYVIASAVILLFILRRDAGACRFSFREMRFYKQPLLRVLKLGVPAGIQASTFSMANVIIQSSVNSFGAVAISGAAAAQNLTGFLHVCTNSFHHAALNFVGQNYGAKKFDRIKRTVWICVLCAAVIGFAIGLLMYVFATPLLSLYIPGAAEAIQYGTTRLLIATVPYFLVGVLDVFTGVMRGMGSSTVPMFVTIFANCLMRVVWVFTVFKFVGTWASLYLAYPVSWSCGTIVIVICFIGLFRRKKRLEERTE
jgi:hypothetical protein